MYLHTMQLAMMSFESHPVLNLSLWASIMVSFESHPVLKLSPWASIMD